MAAETIEDVIEDVIWVSQDKDYAIVRLSRGCVARGPLLIGEDIVVGDAYRLHGKWTWQTYRGKRSLQFRWDAYEAAPNSSKQGVTAYLDYYCEGIGPKRAEALWDRYGEDAIRVLRESPQRVVADGVLPEDVATNAAGVLAKNAKNEELRAELIGLLVGRGFHLRHLLPAVIERWGWQAPQIIRDDPFRMLTCRIPSAGFKRCDRLYLDLGHPLNRPSRARYAILHEFQTKHKGNTWHDERKISAILSEYCSDCQDEFRTEVINFCIQIEALVQRKIDGSLWFAERNKAASEELIAMTIRLRNRHFLGEE